MKTLNLGIVAHVDAGKTSLSERLLFEAGVIHTLGSVDRGTTQTDTLELEKQRGITIQSAVASFTLNGVKINLIDTPGHSDFVAEVERALKVLDGVVLVVSAVEGIQTQTRILSRTLKKLKIPSLIFVNKIDRKGARSADLIEQMTQNLTSRVVPMTSVDDIGTKEARATLLDFEEAGRLEDLAMRLAEQNETFLQVYGARDLLSRCDTSCPREQVLDACHQELATQTAQALISPLYFGSAITGSGIPELMNGITLFLPVRSPDTEAPLQGTLFKIERGDSGEKIAYARLYSGAIHTRDSLILHRQERSGKTSQHQAKVTALQSFDQGKSISLTTVAAGNIAKIWGLKEAKIGDTFCPSQLSIDTPVFFPPTLEIVVQAEQAADEPRLFDALQWMNEQDPLLHAHRDRTRQEIIVSLYGEVQKEIIQARLQGEFGIPVVFKETKTIYIERVVRPGEAFQEIQRRGPNEFYATLGLKVEPGEPGSGISYRLEVELGSMPKSYHHVVEEMVYTTLQHGLYGWAVTDCLVTLTRTGLCPLSSPCEFRRLTPLVLMRAIRQAGTCVCEPISSFELEIPSAMLSQVISALMSAGAMLKETSTGPHLAHIEGRLQTGRMSAFEKRLPSLTQGCGLLLTRFAGYQPVERLK